jgi:hypothetical protein
MRMFLPTAPALRLAEMTKLLAGACNEGNS